ncbi:hypothetical protein EAF00_007372 [Botryotinia globosa]|nr:hypothetical protein EAF00_007372 [Botryotinia globosa]
MDVRGSLANPLNKQLGAPSILVTPNVIPRFCAFSFANSFLVRTHSPELVVFKKWIYKLYKMIEIYHHETVSVKVFTQRSKKKKVNSMASFIIYGTTGYSCRLTSEYAKSLDLNFSITGRTEHKLKSLASLLDASYSVFNIKQVDLTDLILKETSVLFNCADPFVHTSKPLIEACIRNKVHCLDIAAELDSYQHAQKLDKESRDVSNIQTNSSAYDQDTLLNIVMGGMIFHDIIWEI